MLRGIFENDAFSTLGILNSEILVATFFVYFQAARLHAWAYTVNCNI